MIDTLTHAERDRRDAAYMADLRAVRHSNQHQRGLLMRRVISRHFPHMRAIFNALPELEKI